MDGKLLVRVYNVGLGDCIYLRVPDKGRKVHILIDCGNKFGKLDLLGERIKHLKEKDLPNAGQGKKRLDLLVVSHPHEDHHKGFEEKFFNDIQIGHIWLSPAFNRDNPQAKGFYALQEAAGRALGALESLSKMALEQMSDDVRDLLSLSKSAALEMLNKTLPERNGIQPQYVTADTLEDQLKIFAEPGTKLKVLGPMSDIDGYYLGGNGLMNTASGLPPSTLEAGYQAMYLDPASVEIKPPQNISAQDFKQLRSRIHANALAAAAVVGHAVNNLSIVLLLEWHGRRLLFSGDAEWSSASIAEVQTGKSNGSWNVMWHKRRADLSKPLDFYKIGHHGSENATPWKPPDPKAVKEPPINEILDKLLPKPKAGKTPQAYAIASTQRTPRWPSIPNAELMQEIGKRIANTEKYVEKEGPKSVKPQVPQPQRTDLKQVEGKPVPFIEMEFSKKG